MFHLQPEACRSNCKATYPPTHLLWRDQSWMSFPVLRRDSVLGRFSSEQVCFRVWQRRGGNGLRGAVSFDKHVRNVLAKVDLTISCYGLVLHQLQVLWCQLQLQRFKRNTSVWVISHKYKGCLMKDLIQLDRIFLSLIRALHWLGGRKPITQSGVFFYYFF